MDNNRFDGVESLPGLVIVCSDDFGQVTKLVGVSKAGDWYASKS